MKKEYRVKLIVRNNLILSAIEKAGFKSQAEFCRFAQLPNSRINALIGLRECPINYEGNFTDLAKDLMEVLGACPTDLWSTEQLNMRLKVNSTEGEISKIELLSVLGMNPIDLIEFKNPDVELYEKEEKSLVKTVLKTLNFNEQSVIGKRFFDEKTLRTVSKELNLTPERIRQIEKSAIRKLRHPNKSNILKHLIEN
jgi:RNA polymerase sigma factor (sigma-70 family)